MIDHVSLPREIVWIFISKLFRLRLASFISSFINNLANVCRYSRVEQFESRMDQRNILFHMLRSLCAIFPLRVDLRMDNNVFSINFSLTRFILQYILSFTKKKKKKKTNFNHQRHSSLINNFAYVCRFSSAFYFWEIVNLIYKIDPTDETRRYARVRKLEILDCKRLEWWPGYANITSKSVQWYLDNFNAVKKIVDLYRKIQTLSRYLSSVLRFQRSPLFFHVNILSITIPATSSIKHS